MYAETSKNEATWYRMLGHYDAEYDTAPRVVKGQWHGRHSIHMRREWQPASAQPLEQHRQSEAQPELL